MRYHLFCKECGGEEAGEIIRPPKDPAKEARPLHFMASILPTHYLPTWTLSIAATTAVCDYGPLQ